MAVGEVEVQADDAGFPAADPDVVPRAPSAADLLDVAQCASLPVADVRNFPVDAGESPTVPVSSAVVASSAIVVQPSHWVHGTGPAPSSSGLGSQM